MILTDRAVDSEDTSLYKTFLGSDFVQEGEKAGEWLVDNAGDADVNGDGKVNVVQLEGTTGAAPAIDRERGLRGRHRGRPERSRSSPRRPATSPVTAARRSWRRS